MGMTGGGGAVGGGSECLTGGGVGTGVAVGVSDECDGGRSFCFIRLMTLSDSWRRKEKYLSCPELHLLVKSNTRLY